MLKAFRDFAIKGNVLDLAVAVIIGTAFGKIVTSFVNDIMMPPIGFIAGAVDFSNLFLNFTSTPALTLAEAKKLGLATLNYGVFINVVIDFAITAFAVFVLVRIVATIQKRATAAAAAAAPTTKDCPLCLMTIPIGARKCGHCASELA